MKLYPCPNQSVAASGVITPLAPSGRQVPSVGRSGRRSLSLQAEMLKRGFKVAMGIDGQAFVGDDNALREIRLLWSLHADWWFDRAFEPSEILSVALNIRSDAVGAGIGGCLVEGQPDNLLILDRAVLDEDALMPVHSIELLFSHGNRSHLRELIVAGRTARNARRLSRRHGIPRWLCAVLVRL